MEFEAADTIERHKNVFVKMVLKQKGAEMLIVFVTICAVGDMVEPPSL